MPIYEYKCQSCQKIEEKFYSASSYPEKKKCIYCGGRAIKIFRPAPVIFKGSGFYITESRKSKEKKAEQKEEKEKKGEKKSQEKTKSPREDASRKAS